MAGQFEVRIRRAMSLGFLEMVEGQERAIVHGNGQQSRMPTRTESLDT
jgi:hypothetical protein